ncbi:hypothetical protein ACT3CE_01220 [Marinifilum sp. RC60d5]|uniref:hypothetical protein n=1 Tax=Marinifilum sp. RC60d5 TaxID=3458414 RepID=UPI004035F73C
MVLVLRLKPLSNLFKIELLPPASSLSFTQSAYVSVQLSSSVTGGFGLGFGSFVPFSPPPPLAGVGVFGTEPPPVRLVDHAPLSLSKSTLAEEEQFDSC